MIAYVGCVLASYLLLCLVHWRRLELSDFNLWGKLLLLSGPIGLVWYLATSAFYLVARAGLALLQWSRS